MPADAPACGVQQAYVLHQHDWSETSLILDLFTRESGRLAVAAKGAKRPYSQLRAVLLPLQRISVSLSKPGQGRRRRGADAAQRGVGRRRDDASRRRAVLRLLPERAAAQAAGPPRPASPALFDAYADTLAHAVRGRRGAARLRAETAGRAGLLPDLSVVTPRRRPSIPSAATSCRPSPASSRPQATPACPARCWSSCRPRCCTAAWPRCARPAPPSRKA